MYYLGWDALRGEPVKRTLCMHSKLAIIDNRHLIVGSANWNYRSMRDDGEVTAFIDNANLAAAAKNSIFAHWQHGGALTEANIEATATLNAQTIAGAGHGPAMRNRWQIMPISLPVFPWLSFPRVVPDTEKTPNHHWFA
jgi:phosphatidylserine/phosphatidylglycerophosphate/cardiolipin synthase-like enzyme